MRIRTTVLVLIAALSLVACRADEPALDDGAAWRTSTDPVDTTGLVWASGSTVHLGDGTTIDTGQSIRAYVVAGDGVFFVPGEGDEDLSEFTGAELFFAAPGQKAEETGLSVASEGTAVSPDGSRIAVLDADYDDGSAVMRIFDLSSGHVTTSEDGMDNSDINDPVDNLLEMEVEILGITDESVYARVIDGDYAYDLATGEGRPLGDDEEVPGHGADPRQSPDGTWQIEQDDGLRDTIVSAEGEEVTPETGTSRWTLSRWVDTDTVLGIAIDGPGRGAELGPEDTLTLMTCEVPSGTCDQIPETTGQLVTFPLRTQPTSGIRLVIRDGS